MGRHGFALGKGKREKGKAGIFPFPLPLSPFPLPPPLCPMTNLQHIVTILNMLILSGGLPYDC